MKSNRDRAGTRLGALDRLTRRLTADKTSVPVPGERRGVEGRGGSAGARESRVK